jgi:hypothetical protein
MRQVSGSRREWQKRRAEAVAEVRKAVGRLAGEVEDLRSEGSHEDLTVRAVARAKDQLRAEAVGLRSRLAVLEQDSRRISEAKELRAHSLEAPAVSGVIAVVSLRGGSSVTGG